jgi:diguanylate cyclase (GGDEF)-like protein/PAS domain S-box-containing protein
MSTVRQPAAPAATRRLPHRNKLLQELTDFAAVPTFLAATDGEIFYVNRAFADLLGYEPHEMVGKGVDTIVHPDFRRTAHEQVRSLDAGATERYQAERRYLKKNGDSIWVLASAAALRDPGGRRLYTIIQAVDIDRQKRAEAALAESESRWNSALESAGQGVWDFDLTTTPKVFYSRMWRLMRGIEPDEEIASDLESWLARVHPDDRERIREIVRRQDSGEIARNAFEYRERHKDGRWIWILSRGRPIAWSDDGRPSRIVGTDTDITSLKEVEAQLAAEKERLRVTLRSIGDGVITTDAVGKVTFLNEVAEQMTGWSSGEAIGSPIEEVFRLVAEDDGRPIASPVVACLTRNQRHQLEQDAVLIDRADRRRSISDSAAPVRTPGGETIGAVLVFQDVTDARARQKKLAHSAMHDELTGLPNRAAFKQALEEASETARRDSRRHALCFVDLDRFKGVNDTAGHAAGDSVLRDIAQTIRGVLRSHDIAARIGGDEFALLLPDCTLPGARKVAQNLVNAISTTPFSWDRQVHRIGASVGITAITEGSPPPAELMDEADIALYTAKADRGGQVAVFSKPAERALKRTA